MLILTRNLRDFLMKRLVSNMQSANFQIILFMLGDPFISNLKTTVHTYNAKNWLFFMKAAYQGRKQRLNNNRTDLQDS